MESTEDNIPKYGRTSAIKGPVSTDVELFEELILRVLFVSRVGCLAGNHAQRTYVLRRPLYTVECCALAEYFH